MHVPDVLYYRNNNWPLPSFSFPRHSLADDDIRTAHLLSLLSH